MYNLPQLTELAHNTVTRRMDYRNCLDYLENAQRWPMGSCAAIVDYCFLWLNTFSDVVLASERFCSLDRATLLLILQRHGLDVEESALYAAVERWATAACLRNALDASPDNRCAILGPALFHIRFPLLTDAQLADGPIQSGLLLHSEVTALFLYKHAAVKPPLPFATEPRGGADQRRKRAPRDSPDSVPAKAPKTRFPEEPTTPPRARMPAGRGAIRPPVARGGHGSRGRGSIRGPRGSPPRRRSIR
ncbi:BTB/POZ domain-containing protein 6-like [Paramacrobiotus metropolitanus]|uniref:BTB/POZ domain-containing protein 6-like n=1 Tax=Paramacrobiotus metropolitanus TaxID=2943436 RepID=UPI0024463F6C|nr:BTB/POZ domain-containing protein 6-like [Paramacrobiotus metropolitanus]